jgi:hypothetical protein
MSTTIEKIRSLTRAVSRDEQSFGVLSTGEQIAVALVLNKPEWLKKLHWTMLAAVDRLGDEWFRAALDVQRDGDFL